MLVSLGNGSEIDLRQDVGVALEVFKKALEVDCAELLVHTDYKLFGKAHEEPTPNQQSWPACHCSVVVSLLGGACNGHVIGQTGPRRLAPSSAQQGTGLEELSHVGSGWKMWFKGVKIWQVSWKF